MPFLDCSWGEHDFAHFATRGSGGRRGHLLSPPDLVDGLRHCTCVSALARGNPVRVFGLCAYSLSVSETQTTDAFDNFDDLHLYHGQLRNFKRLLETTGDSRWQSGSGQIGTQ